MKKFDITKKDFTEDLRPILIEITVEWKRCGNKFSKLGISGGYDYHGSPNILLQGGYHSPDFTMTLDEIKERLCKQVDYTNRKVKFKVKVLQDDRNPTMADYF